MVSTEKLFAIILRIFRDAQNASPTPREGRKAAAKHQNVFSAMRPLSSTTSIIRDSANSQARSQHPSTRAPRAPRWTQTCSHVACRPHPSVPQIARGHKNGWGAAQHVATDTQSIRCVAKAGERGAQRRGLYVRAGFCTRRCACVVCACQGVART
eukprot:1633203-Prymnesium_polylepis.1